MYVYPLVAEKAVLFASKSYVRTRDRVCGNPIPEGMRKPNLRGDAETPSPGMLRKPGDLPYPCPRPKKFGRLAMRDTLHESRPNIRQCDPNGRIAPTPSSVSGKGASTKRCARRKKKLQLYVYTRLPSGKFVGEWCKDTLSSLPDAMTIYCTYRKNLPRKNNDFAYLPVLLRCTQWQYLLHLLGTR